MYDDLKKDLGPVQRKISVLKSYTGVILTEKNKQMNRWGRERYSNLHSRQNIVSPETFDLLEHLQTTDELDSVPTIEELSSTIDH